MKTNLTNNTAIPLSMAVWLASDNYDHVASDEYLSATSILKSPRAMVLTKRIEEATMDISALVASRMGTAIHDAIEAVWTNEDKRNKALKALGYPDKVIKQIVVNPTQEQVAEGCIPIYMENHVTKKINGIYIGGKYDYIQEGDLEDFKSTSAWGYVFGSSVKDYVLQGSIYRWLNPEKITGDHIQIDYVFTDWKARDAKANPKYPPAKAMAKKYPLLSLEETEAYLIARTDEYKELINLPEADLPLCTDEELWRGAPVFKYYSNPANVGGKCQKRFDDMPTALLHLQDKGKGTVVEVKGTVNKCNFCNGFDLCSQKDALIADGSLTPS